MKFFFFIWMTCLMPGQRCLAASLSNSKGSDSKANEEYIFKNVYNSGLSSTQVLEILQRMKTVEQKLSEIETKGNCPTGWKTFNGSCYVAFIKPTATWTDARDVCKSLGADLVKITSEAENTFAYGLISADLASVSYVWIGLHRGGDGNFYWVDGSSVSYSGWDSGEPSSSSEKCGVFHSGQSIPSKWHDTDCTNSWGYICELVKAK